jgi:hypothetical protein
MIEEEAPGRASLLFSTILRSSCSSQNFSEIFLLELVLSGEIALRPGTWRSPSPCRGYRGRRGSDRGRACGRALRADRPPTAALRGGGRRDRTSGRSGGVRYVPITVEQFASALTQEEVPPSSLRC